jgi:uncharacterized protein
MLEYSGICLIAAASIAFLNFSRRVIYAALTFCLAVCIYQQVVTFLGLLELFILAMLLVVFYAQQGSWAGRMTAFIMSCVLLSGLALHALPGFNNYILFDHIVISAASTPYTLYINFDKTFAGLIIYSFSPYLLMQEPLNLSKYKLTIYIAVVAIITLLVPALLTGYIRFDPKIPTIFVPWLLCNLLLVCFVEEVIFRGFLQATLQSWFDKFKHGYYLPLLMTAIIFGVSHYKSGVLMVIFSSVAGLFYGYAYQRTNNIKSPVLVHFAVNLSHLVLFSYPAAR